MLIMILGLMLVMVLWSTEAGMTIMPMGTGVGIKKRRMGLLCARLMKPSPHMRAGSPNEELGHFQGVREAPIVDLPKRAIA